jgi:hypothetical protein
MNNEAELLLLKKQYDIDYLQYWIAGNKPPKFGPITMEEFRERLKQPEFFEIYGRLK